MKYKPKVLPLTQAVSKTGSEGWTFLALITEITLQAKQVIPPMYGCGNPSCTGVFALMSNAKRPLVCSRIAVGRSIGLALPQRK